MCRIMMSALGLICNIFIKNSITKNIINYHEQKALLIIILNTKFIYFYRYSIGFSFYIGCIYNIIENFYW